MEWLISNIRNRCLKIWFYSKAEVIESEWWLSSCSEYPDLYWAEMRIFSNGYADVQFQEEYELYGFLDKESAGYYLCEDEYTRFSNLDADDRRDLNIPLDYEITPPIITDSERKRFIYIGKY